MVDKCKNHSSSHTFLSTPARYYFYFVTSFTSVFGLVCCSSFCFSLVVNLEKVSLKVKKKVSTKDKKCKNFRRTHLFLFLMSSKRDECTVNTLKLGEEFCRPMANRRLNGQAARQVKVPSTSIALRSSPDLTFNR